MQTVDKDFYSKFITSACCELWGHADIISQLQCFNTVMDESVPTGSRQAFSEDWTNASWLCIKCNVLHKPVGQFILDHAAFCVLIWIHMYIFVTFLHFMAWDTAVWHVCTSTWENWFLNPSIMLAFILLSAFTLSRRFKAANHLGKQWLCLQTMVTAPSACENDQL